MKKVWQKSLNVAAVIFNVFVIFVVRIVFAITFVFVGLVGALVALTAGYKHGLDYIATVIGKIAGKIGVY